MGMSIGGSGGAKSDINMTPMIDVLLVLIIIFMIITPIAPRGLNVAVPQAATDQTARPTHDIVVTVRQDGKVLLNHEELDLAQLNERLLALFRNGASNVIFVRGEKALEFGRVAAVIDMARGAGVNRVALMTN